MSEIVKYKRGDISLTSKLYTNYTNRATTFIIRYIPFNFFNDLSVTNFEKQFYKPKFHIIYTPPGMFIRDF